MLKVNEVQTRMKLGCYGPEVTKSKDSNKKRPVTYEGLRLSTVNDNVLFKNLSKNGRSRAHPVPRERKQLNKRKGQHEKN